MLRTKLLITFTLLICLQVRSQERTDSKRIKVLSFNIYHGENMEGNSNLEAVAAIINKIDPDFVGLQEVDMNTERSHKTDISTLLGYKTNMHPIFAKAMDFNGGEYGVALLSKHSFNRTELHALPTKVDKEPRVLVTVNTAIHKNKIQIINTHFDHTKEERLRLEQVAFVNQLFCKDQLPKILIGDLNALPDSKTIHELEKNWKASYNPNVPKATYPSNAPTKKIDYIMAYPKDKWKVIASTVINTGISSDHLAYLVTLELL